MRGEPKTRLRVEWIYFPTNHVFYTVIPTSGSNGNKLHILWWEGGAKMKKRKKSKVFTVNQFVIKFDPVIMINFNLINFNVFDVNSIVMFAMEIIKNLH
jgi:hypothetical protein